MGKQDDYAPFKSNREPYRSGLSPLASEHRKVTGTRPQLILLNALAKAGLNPAYEHPISTGVMHPVWGEIAYSCDVFVPSARWPNEGIDVEVDGNNHYASLKQEMKDRKKEVFLKGKGIVTVRFTNAQAIHDTDACVLAVKVALEKLER